jgi:ribosomal peptide maturation radical SAM protein 1
MFFEVKANLRYEQLQMMRAAGVVAIQPGIESLDDGVLQLMRKGCTALQNITLLRWCRELGVTAAWNLLGGFPGEPAEAYHAMSELLPLLVHLDPPSACSPVRLDRFSPFATAPDAFGMRRVRPAHAYYYVYPLERRELERLAYFFDFDYADGCVPLEYMRELIAASNDWRFRHADRASAPALDAFEEPDGTIRVHDTRPGFEDDFLLDGLDAEVFARCDTIRTASTLDVPGVPADEVAASLARLRERRVLIAIGNRYLSLAVFRTRLRGMDREYSAAPAAQPLLRAG